MYLPRLVHGLLSTKSLVVISTLDVVFATFSLISVFISFASRYVGWSSVRLDMHLLSQALLLLAPSLLFQALSTPST
jgi:hypothetical protein